MNTCGKSMNITSACLYEYVPRTVIKIGYGIKSKVPEEVLVYMSGEDYTAKHFRMCLSLKAIQLPSGKA